MLTMPRADRIVWLANSYSRVAHNALDGVRGTDCTRTKCGRVTATWGDGYRENGVTVDWSILDHDVVRPCAKCFRVRDV